MSRHREAAEPARGRIVCVGHAENDLKMGIVLQAMAAERLIHFGIGTAQRLQDGDRRHQDGPARLGEQLAILADSGNHQELVNNSTGRQGRKNPRQKSEE